jgi:hypothetical protein
MIRFVKPGRVLVLCSRNARPRAVTDWPLSAPAPQRRESRCLSLGQEGQSPALRLPVSVATVHAEVPICARRPRGVRVVRALGSVLRP